MFKEGLTRDEGGRAGKSYEEMNGMKGQGTYVCNTRQRPVTQTPVQI